MTVDFIAVLVAGAAMGGFINGLAGFGTALFALGWWLQIMPPQQAVPVVLLMSVASGIQGCWIVRHAIRWRRLAMFLVPALFGIPLGLSVLDLIDADQLKLVIGGFMLLYGLFFAFRRTLPRYERPTPVIDGGIGFVGGILGATAGLSGALPTMWISLRGWTKEASRGVLQPYNMAVLGLSVSLLAMDGAYDRQTLLLCGGALVPTLLAAQVGILTFRRLGDATFRRLLIVLMLVSGGALLVRSLF
ncbi:sulfite exporter TauE/SafE family protein [Paralimibaculum aggregatum]|uniref:Probable membrane transporter protein n=1 Tax=Paralimibaculum aggregatum TaxID=3036245 RepID=A0ABQ6LNQ8_9RHOB|nr:sulfite exporter TauE/SafE family protein [Limibaculum sp. NKW23]GMG84855.1 sulfite exporter TauE/SafE family protein [Limibaculum sp. NKW23]